MSRPTHILKHEHRIIEQAMRALEGMCLRMKAGMVVPYEELAKLLDFIQNYADRYHHVKEESYLFPALEGLGIQDQNGPLSFLREEHITERKLLYDLAMAIEDYRYNQAADEKIIVAAQLYKTHLIEHMEQEDTILFNLAEEIMDDPLKDEVNHKLSEEPTESPGMTERYECLAAELEKSWSV